jgi:ferritin
MVSKTMIQALNKQIELEAYASQLYLSMASWCDKESMEGSSKFMHEQSEEERMHMLKIFHYISEVDGHAIAPEIKQPPLEFKSVQKMFAQVYEHEKEVTTAINSLVELAYKEDDFSTMNFLQWYVEEQREEENLMRTILDRIKLIGEGPLSLYYIDKEIQAINKEKAAGEHDPA